MNTLDIEAGRDEIAAPEALADWLLRYSLLPHPAALTDDDLRRAVEVREALRSFLAVNSGVALDTQALAVLNAAAARAHLVLTFNAAGPASLEQSAQNLDGAFGRVLVIAALALEDGTWARLKICRNGSCGWVFYDRSKNRSSAWCSMSICGNRMKARKFRLRHRNPKEDLLTDRPAGSPEGN